MCSQPVQGRILKCISVGIHLLNVVWDEKFLVIGFVRLVLPKGLLFYSVFPAGKRVNSSLLVCLRLLRFFCLFHFIDFG